MVYGTRAEHPLLRRHLVSAMTTTALTRWPWLANSFLVTLATLARVEPHSDYDEKRQVRILPPMG